MNNGHSAIKWSAHCCVLKKRGMDIIFSHIDIIFSPKRYNFLTHRYNFLTNFEIKSLIINGKKCP